MSGFVIHKAYLQFIAQKTLTSTPSRLSARKRAII